MLLCSENQTIVEMWFCGPKWPFKICSISGFCIAPCIAVWVQLLSFVVE